MVEPAEIYTHHRTVMEEDLDDLKHVNNVIYVQWIQDIAKEHWEVRATEKLKKNFIWVVIRHEIDYKKQAFLNDDILIETYVGETTFVTSERFVNIKNAETGEILVAAKSMWCLLDADSKRPTKITDDLRQVFHKQ
ncbi:MAG: acyl-CoA thioesterase [Salinimicrobium sediminis]|uniref:Acyl-CoA thioester hydrolase n=1 Tax=Salinimicrobium sediminis TaxID=1343891 RepID=A0A285X5F2_9FLAO|nr:acyl-CoA thioesterase [Salinimicrobium sediminis]MDX1604101.1 acyl-CoA thioesterase [Salinimicrobium sediminis]MDX1754271.1 acyl-CoA thioesterase [Salinimicrobium sediminis]SOC80560.1 acyl-CoA thioester hydrolase [Salinimicrobium sediminis]